jgi:predicted site-specific integrase-resolvase
MQTNTKLLMKRKQVADLLGVSTHSVARYTRNGQLPTIVINSRTIRYRAEDVQRFVDQSRVE